MVVEVTRKNELNKHDRMVLVELLEEKLDYFQHVSDTCETAEELDRFYSSCDSELECLRRLLELFDGNDLYNKDC